MENSIELNIINNENVVNGKYKFVKKHSTHSISQNSHSLNYLLNGFGVLCIDGIKIDIKQGQSFFIHPKANCTFECGTENCEIIFVSFSSEEYLWLISHTAFSSGVHTTPVIELPEPEKLFNVTSEGKGEIYQYIKISAKMYDLLSYYIKYFPTEKENFNHYVITARKYIELNYKNPEFTATDVSKYLKLDRSYLYKLFKAEVNMSVHNYINNLRITRAEALLKNTNLSIKDIASASGFSDQMYFSRLFKKKKNLTPSQYRKVSRESKTAGII